MLVRAGRQNDVRYRITLIRSKAEPRERAALGHLHHRLARIIRAVCSRRQLRQTSETNSITLDSRLWGTLIFLADGDTLPCPIASDCVERKA